MPTSSSSSCNDLRLSTSIAAMTKLSSRSVWLQDGTWELKYHATIPVLTGNTAKLKPITFLAKYLISKLTSWSLCVLSPAGVTHFSLLTSHIRDPSSWTKLEQPLPPTHIFTGQNGTKVSTRLVRCLPKIYLMFGVMSETWCSHVTRNCWYVFLFCFVF